MFTKDITSRSKGKLVNVQKKETSEDEGEINPDKLYIYNLSIKA